MIINEDIICVGVNDRKIDLFEGQFTVENGMAYNSYAIKDEKTAVMDSVEGSFAQEWLDNINNALNNRAPDYLIVSHMEPDHSSGLYKFLERYNNTKIVASGKAFDLMKNFFGTDFADRKIVVKEGDKLNLGKHELTFIFSPMVHWPEVIMTYDSYGKVLFSADAFGKFGTTDTDEDWACEARRYYFGIVGKYGAQVQNALKKLSAFSISAICPLHGPVLTDNLPYYFNLYNIWSSYGVETDGVVICYTSVYGHTEKAVKLLAQKLAEKNCPKITVNDLARSDMAECVEDAFRYGKIILATTTYNADIFPFMKEFIEQLKERNFQKKKVGLIENGSWAPVAAKVMKTLLTDCKEISFCQNTVKILSALTQENEKEIDALAEEILK